MNQDTTHFQSILATEMTDFLTHQRALGKRFLNEEGALRLFDQYLAGQNQRPGSLAARCQTVHLHGKVQPDPLDPSAYGTVNT